MHPSTNHRRIALAGGTLLVLAALAACGRSPAAAPKAAPSAAVTGSTSPAPAAPPTTNPPTPVSAPVRPAGADCRPGDLDPRTIYGNGAAAGSHGQQVVVRNAGATPCRLATFPTLRQPDGQPVPAQRRDDGGQPAIVLAPGQYAGFLVMTPNGYSGYDPSSPACAHPRTYDGLSVVLGGGLGYPLRSFQVSLLCGDVSIGAWRAIANPMTEVPNPTQLPR